MSKRNTMVVGLIEIHEKPHKKYHKKIYKIKFKKLSSKSILLWLTVDGGLPIKRFIEGNDISPNLTKFLGIQCICKQFDFKDVKLLN